MSPGQFLSSRQIGLTINQPISTAIIKPEHYAEIYLPYPARLESWAVEKGSEVASGDVLAELTSDELQFESQNTAHESDILSWQLTNQGTDAQLAKKRQIRLKQLESAAAKHAGINTKIEKLRIKAPIAGTVIERNYQLQTGQWLKTGEALLVLADPSRYLIEAYVSESDIKHIKVGNKGTFYPEPPELDPIDCQLIAIDDGSSVNVPPLLASNFGGPIAVRTDKNQTAIPENAQYRLQLETKGVNLDRVIQLRGTLKLNSNSYSVAEKITRQSIVLGIEQSGF